MSDFTGKELAQIMERERKMKLQLHRLTISKVLDRKGLALVLKKNLFPSISILEALKIIDNLPFIDNDMWAEPSHIKEVLSPYCEFTYEQIPFQGNESIHNLPWESPQYIQAKDWYNSLSEEDRKRIDILIQASMPYA